jgi:hypothetical protein
MDVKTIKSCGPPKPGEWNECGLDMVFLSVPSEYLGSIKAHRDFYSPNVDGKAAPPGSYVEVMVLMGTPAAFGIFKQTHAEVQINGCFVNPDTPYKTHGDFDYFDLAVGASPPDTPESHGGVSGGGLWRVLIRCECSTGELEWVQALEGVAFYQSAIEDGRRTIRCHGPRSILAATPLG